MSLLSKKVSQWIPRGWCGQDEIIKGHRVNIGAMDVFIRMVTMVS